MINLTHIKVYKTLYFVSGWCTAGEQVNPNNLTDCLKCDYNTYQDNPDPVYLVDNCTQCPDDKGTQVQGANSSELCMSEYLMSSNQIFIALNLRTCRYFSTKAKPCYRVVYSSHCTTQFQRTGSVYCLILKRKTKKFAELCSCWRNVVLCGWARQQVSMKVEK